MKLNLLLCFLINISLLPDSKSSIRYCDFTTSDRSKYCYAKEILLAITHSPNQLAVDKSSNTLYFSFDMGQGDFVPAVFNMDNKKLTVLNGVRDAFALASDDSSNIYFGGNNGIYRYEKQSLKQLNIKNLDIWWLYIRNNIYFIKFPNLEAHYYKNMTVKELPELKGKVVHQFVLDKQGNVFFINGSGLYGVRRGRHRDIMLRDNPKFLGMATDNNGDVYVCSEDGIYVVSKMVIKVKKIVNVQGVLGLTFDKLNNIVYTNAYEIVRLVPMTRKRSLFSFV